MKSYFLKKGALTQASPCFRFLLIISAVLFSVNRGPAITYTVTNAASFNNLPDLNAGDIVEMRSGIYGSINKIITSTITNDVLAKSSPIKIYATTPGGVILNAPSNIRFNGSGIIFAGVEFGPGCGLISTNNGEIVGANYSSRYITFSHLHFNACGSTNAAGEDVHWLALRGFNNTVEYCSFNDRPETSSNATVWVMPDIQEGGINDSRNHWIHHNYFGTRYAGVKNGSESIRIGVGDVQTFNMQVLVEKNVFYHSIWRTNGFLSQAGEPEIISNKSKGNIIRNNTILESQGGICLRTGQYCTVEGNFIFGGGYYSSNGIAIGNTNALQRGIRVIGKNHIIRNNYVANVIGTYADAALCVMSGESNYYEGDPVSKSGNIGFYLPADNAQIYNNTFINCAQMNLGYLAPDSYGAPASPTNVLIYNNAWQGNGSTSAALVRDTTSTNSAPGYTPIVLGGSGGNYIYETSSSKYGWTNDLVGTYSANGSPPITETLGNYKIPTSSSPLINAGNTTLSASNDIRGFARPANNRDIGCYESEATGSTPFAPMLRNEVGATFDGGPSSPLWPVPVITSSLTVSLYRNQTFTYLITATNGPTSFNATNLPDGLSVNTGTGEISGAPTGAGSSSVTITAANSFGSGSATLNIQVYETVSTYRSSTTWVCPSNITSVQVECWGGGGAGGSAIRGTGGSATGGGGAGGAYAKCNSYPVVPGATYYINVGEGGSSSISDGAREPGGDSWFNSSNGPSTLVLAKGGAGGQSVVANGNTVFGSGGTGTTNLSIGDVVRAGGSGATSGSNAFGGGGGGSAGSLLAGNAPASTTNGLGAPAVVPGGGDGGNANPIANSSENGQSPKGVPGGGGGGARSASTSQKKGGSGAAGQVIVTLIIKANSTISISGGSFTYNGSPQGPGLENVTKTGSTSSNLTYRYEGVAPTVYSDSTKPTEVGTYTVTATLPEDSNFKTAVSAPTEFSIVAPTFSRVFGTGVNPTNIGTDGLAYLMKYSLGGTNTNDNVSLPTIALNGSNLTMTAVVRTNDTNVTIVGQSVSDLTGTWSNIPTNPYGTASTNTSNVPNGCQRRDFSVNGGTNNRTFLRLKASQ
jgi:parallel beta-helix repeat protein